MNKGILIVGAFLFGILFHITFSTVQDNLITGFVVADKPSPQGFVALENVLQYDSGIYLKHPEITLVQFSDTKSMDPLIDKNTLGIVIPTDNPQVGDIAIYIHDGQTIGHRIIRKEHTDGNVYFILQGDNNPLQDGYKVPKENIQGVVMGLIYTNTE